VSVPPGAWQDASVPVQLSYKHFTWVFPLIPDTTTGELQVSFEGYSITAVCRCVWLQVTHSLTTQIEYTDQLHRVHTSDRAKWVHLQKVQAPPSLSSHFTSTYTSASNWSGPITQHVRYSNQNTPLQWQYTPSLR